LFAPWTHAHASSQDHFGFPDLRLGALFATYADHLFAHEFLHAVWKARTRAKHWFFGELPGVRRPRSGGVE
jgi:hypothetical protein